MDSATDSLAWTLLVAGLGCTAIAIVQALDLWTGSEWIARTPTLRRPGANLAQPNQMATMVLMAAASLIYLHEQGRVGRAVGLLLGMLLVIGLSTTESRTGLLAATTLAAWWFCKGYKSRFRPSQVVLALSVVFTAYIAWPPMVEAFHAESASELARMNTQVGFRAIVWPQLVEAVARRPWLGWGVRQTSAALTSVVDAYPVSEPYTYAHNIILELVLGFGLPLGVVLLGGATVWVIRRWHARAHVGGWYCMALWVPLLVHSLLEFPYSYAYFLAPAMFALGLLEGSSRVAALHRVPITIVAGVLAFGIALGLWSVFEYVQAEEDFRVARFEAVRIGTTPTDYQRPRLQVLTQLGAMVEAARLVPAPGMTPEAVTFAGDVAARFPWPALQNRYALALALNGRPGAAEREILVIRAMHGEDLFKDIRQNWAVLKSEKYPELAAVHMPAVPTGR
ncbi:MAG: hypothetical protein NVS2B4_03620 [Ramlibacter sp.]